VLQPCAFPLKLFWCCGHDFKNHQKMKTMIDSNNKDFDKELEEKMIWLDELHSKANEYRYWVARLNGPENLYNVETVKEEIAFLRKHLLFHLPVRYRAKYKL